MKKFQSTLIIIPFLCLILLSCSKEEKEVVAIEPDVPSFDQGHIIIKMNEVTFGVDPATLVTDIELTNFTKGTVHSINPALFTYIQASGFSSLTTTFANGNINDQMQCCVNLSAAVNVSIGMRFENLPADSVQLQAISSNSYCGSGNYQ